MKKFVMLFAVLAIFIVPSNFCAAKEVPVYYGSWNQFLNSLKSGCNSQGIKFKGTTKNSSIDYIAYFNNRHLKVRAFSDNFNGYITNILVYCEKGGDLDAFSGVFGSTLMVLGLNHSELEKFFNKWTKDVGNFINNYNRNSSKSNRFSKKYSVYCSSKNKYIDIEMEFEEGIMAMGFGAHT